MKENHKMELLYLLLLLVSCAWCLGNLSIPESNLDFMIVDDAESERELSSQLQEIDERSSGWSPWSEWTPCSRSCDGGASHQIRSCKNGPCKGKHVRYRICNMQAIIAFFACLAATNASWFAGPSAKIIQGPSSKTTVVGPDGSVISAVAPGGQIVHEEHPGYVAHAAPVVSYAAPHHVSHHASVVAHHAPVVAHHDVHAYAAPSVVHHGVHAYAAPVAHHHGVYAYAAPVAHAYAVPAHSSVVAHGEHGSESVVVAGPSGTVATSKSHSAPVVAHHAPVVAHHGVHHGLYL